MAFLTPNTYASITSAIFTSLTAWPNPISNIYFEFDDDPNEPPHTFFMAKYTANQTFSKSLSIDITSMKWKAEQHPDQGNKWTIQDTTQRNNQLYLSLENTASPTEDMKVVGSNTPFYWDLWKADLSFDAYQLFVDESLLAVTLAFKLEDPDQYPQRSLILKTSSSQLIMAQSWIFNKYDNICAVCATTCPNYQHGSAP